MAGGGSHKAKRELEEARKSGVLPPEQDAKTGELINPHIPQFMAKAPWYLSQGEGPSLAHQRKAEEQRNSFGFETFYRRGEFAGQATTYRKGACKNCGSMTHKEKDCVERPRAVGAWKSGKDIAPDEMLPGGMQLDWDSKRDRWAGYDAAAHNETIARYEAAEEERKRVRAEIKAKELADEAAAKEAKKAARAERRASKKATRAARAVEMAAATAAASPSPAAPADAQAGHSSSDNGSSAGASSEAAAAAVPPAGATAEGKAAKARPDDDAATASDAGSVTDSDGGSGTDSDSDTDFSDSGGDDSDADVRERDSAALLQAEVKAAGTQKKMSVRNLRVREDTAKYLHNLDVNSAFYDPKTRSMRENPYEEGNSAPSGVLYRGDAAAKTTGGAGDFAQDQVFAWDAAEAGADGVHLQANPTQLALLKKQFEERKAALVGAKAARLRDTYGAAEGVEAIPAELRLGQGEGYVEFTADGRVKAPKGGARPTLPSKSRYEEDVWPGNHTSVWGSFYDRSTRSWGYACCHAALASSYCTGAAGRAAREDAERYAASAAAAGSAVTSAALSSGSVGAGAVPRSSMYGEQLAPTIDPVKLKAAMEKQARKEAAEAAAAAAGDGDGEGAGRGGGPNRKRGYNSLSGEADAGTMTAEDMEVWKLKRSRVGDPMAQFGRGSGGGGGGGASGAGGGYGEEDDGEG